MTRTKTTMILTMRRSLRLSESLRNRQYAAIGPRTPDGSEKYNATLWSTRRGVRGASGGAVNAGPGIHG
jgi:hypothetical protein